MGSSLLHKITDMAANPLFIRLSGSPFSTIKEKNRGTG